MKNRSLLVLSAAALSVVFFFAVSYATSQGAGTITMNSTVFTKHKKGLVTFTHNKHQTDYKIVCTECHHVYKGGKNVWAQGHAVKKCNECHTEAKASRSDKLSKKDKIKKYYYSAIHENCKGCHKDLAKAGKAAGPTKCGGCHPKK